jgi:hypothetical protein
VKESGHQKKKGDTSVSFVCLVIAVGCLSALLNLEDFFNASDLCALAFLLEKTNVRYFSLGFERNSSFV